MEFTAAEDPANKEKNRSPTALPRECFMKHSHHTLTPHPLTTPSHHTLTPHPLHHTLTPHPLHHTLTPHPLHHTLTPHPHTHRSLTALPHECFMKHSHHTLTPHTHTHTHTDTHTIKYPLGLCVLSDVCCVVRDWPSVCTVGALWSESVPQCPNLPCHSSGRLPGGAVPRQR